MDGYPTNQQLSKASQQLAGNPISLGSHFLNCHPVVISEYGVILGDCLPGQRARPLSLNETDDELLDKPQEEPFRPPVKSYA